MPFILNPLKGVLLQHGYVIITVRKNFCEKRNAFVYIDNILHKEEAVFSETLENSTVINYPAAKNSCK